MGLENNPLYNDLVVNAPPLQPCSRLFKVHPPTTPYSTAGERRNSWGAASGGYGCLCGSSSHQQPAPTQTYPTYVYSHMRVGSSGRPGKTARPALCDDLQSSFARISGSSNTRDTNLPSLKFFRGGENKVSGPKLGPPVPEAKIDNQAKTGRPGSHESRCQLE